MLDDSALVISAVPLSAHPEPRVEFCEHKGVGHPDSICDGVAEAVSRALCVEYLRTQGRVLHHNVDKALLVGGQSRPRFGGGEVTQPPRLIVCGRATGLPDRDLDEFVCRAARRYLRTTLHCDPDLFRLESAVHNGSANLKRIFDRYGDEALANDTSFGCGHFPYSNLESAVLDLSRELRSSKFRSAFPAAGDDYKIMGRRIDRATSFTVALALVDREVASVREYFRIKEAMVAHLKEALGVSCDLLLNLLDDSNARDETGVYLTVTGLSAEHGDDGQVGRGNRVNGLITPGRSMSLEAAAGKNPVAHVGKIYNVLAMEMARAIAKEVEGVAEVSVQILSSIGKPVAEPQAVAIEVVTTEKWSARTETEIARIAHSALSRVDNLTDRLVRGEASVF